MKSMFISGNTDPGRRRKENQDAWIAQQLWSPDNALLAVIDGVGGYTGGEKAAAIARESIIQYMQLPKGDTLTMLREAVIFANNRIVEERKKDQHISEMCCVLTAVVADAATQSLYFAHVGDTRLYRYREGKLQKLTKDHSFVGIREDAGEMTELEAMNHPHRNQILREVGSTPHRLDDEDFMDYGRDELLPGDSLLLCSDGLTDMITVQQVTTVLSTGQPLPNKVSSLIALANEMGGNDNITVVLLKRKPVTAKKQVPVVNPIAEVKDAQPATPVEAKDCRLSTADCRLPTADCRPSTADPRPKTHNTPPRLLWAALILLLVAGAGWYFTPPKRMEIPPPEVIVVDSNKATTAVRVNHPAVPGPVVEEQTDTLRIAATKSWKYIQQYVDSIGKTLVILPAKNNQTKFAAIEINDRSANPGDTILIKNIRVKNFETGIKVQVPILLKTDNLVFENIKYPFNNLVKSDSSHPSLLIMNNVKR
ncbi:serine/threonine-protein phosphatase [Paraflavitalea soli]|uniref:Serine/threonine-protein phosphatase n=1 Tax=Paraflavitalea soli TaxID=2315862 RepID=A0A3B7MWE1_9BACT|nr:protein phosphatase 2C domain-containing protein [Paraflavitalea soli]AXY77350.1 serine/threonine-protein phosphatase [Paraflavitalea soli]